MSTHPTPRRRLAAGVALALLGAGAGLAPRATDATWQDQVRLSGAVESGTSCTPTDVAFSPQRERESAWDEVGQVSLLDLPATCAGLSAEVTLRGAGGAVLGQGSTLAGSGTVAVPLTDAVQRADIRSASLTIGGWPLAAERRSPVVAVGGSVISASPDLGSTWTAAATLDGTAAAVATDGRGTWVAVGAGPGGAAIWRSTGGDPSAWASVALPGEPSAQGIRDLPLRDVATDGRGTWVAVGGDIEAGPPLQHRPAVWHSTDDGQTWTATGADEVAGGSQMASVATDGTHWVATGASWAGLGTAWSTTDLDGGWSCASSHRVADAANCPTTGPSAYAPGVATDGAGRWVTVGSGYADGTTSPCRAAAGAWLATGDDVATWAGRTLSGTAPTCTSVPENGAGVAAGPGGTWMAVGTGGAGAWMSLDGGGTWGAAADRAVNGTAVATDHEGRWLVATGASVLRTTWTGGVPAWTKVNGVAATDLAFDQLLPMG